MRHEILRGAKQDRPARSSCDSAVPGDAGVAAALSSSEIAELKRMLEARRARDAYFGSDLFSDPAWDILLHAFIAEQDEEKPFIDETCVADIVPGTTAARWLKKLEQQGLLVRLIDTGNSEQPLMKLSAAGKGAMAQYLASFWRSALPV